MSAPIGRELVVSAQGAAASHPIIVFQGLSDDQFSQVLTLFAPKPVTKESLMLSPAVTQQMGAVVGYLESLKYMSANCDVFQEEIVANHFDNVMIEKLNDPDATFSINEWFNTVRGPLPPEIANYNPDEDANGDYMPTPEYTGLDVDWIRALTDQELAHNGFIALFYNCIQMERQMHVELEKNRSHGRTTSSLFTRSRPAPATIYDSSMLQYDLTTDDLMRFNHGSSSSRGSTFGASLH
jgi:hypothetical protein